MTAQCNTGVCGSNRFVLMPLMFNESWVENLACEWKGETFRSGRTRGKGQGSRSFQLGSLFLETGDFVFQSLQFFGIVSLLT